MTITTTAYAPLDVSPIGVWDFHPVAHHNGSPVDESRHVVRIDDLRWPFLPEQCLAGPSHTSWWLEGQLLVCNGCGLDLT